MDRRRLLATTGVVLGIAGAVGAVTIAPWLAALSAAGAVVAAVGSMLGPDEREFSASDIAGTDEVAPAEAAPTALEVIESSQLATAGAATATPGPLADSGPTVASPDSGPASALTDPLTGLFSEDYFDVAIEARIAAARRHLRPVGVVVLEVVEGLRVGRTQPGDPKRVATAIKETLREADTACRRRDGHFALLLEDTPETGAIWTAERIRRFLADRDPTLTMWAGVACYPAHGFDADGLLALAEEALGAAREWHQDRIEVAVSE